MIAYKDYLEVMLFVQQNKVSKADIIQIEKQYEQLKTLNEFINTLYPSSDNTALQKKRRYVADYIVNQNKEEEEEVVVLEVMIDIVLATLELK